MFSLKIICFIRVVLTTLSQYIDLLKKLYLFGRRRCADIGGPDMGDLTVQFFRLIT